MKKRRDDRRMIAPEYHLIVTEGTQTEPKYFTQLRDEINKKYKDRISIQIEGIGEGSNTLSLLDKAQEIVLRSPIEFKHVWLVYDKDDFPKDDFDNTHYRCQALSKQNDSVMYHALWSNECIEYWFLLHFNLLQSAISRREYYPRLSEYLGSKYEKNRDDIYTLLKPNLENAIRNAKQVIDTNKDTPPSQCAPGTKVYEIFEKLLCYIK
ncbi:MAG: RloB family protein [Oscillospiraceae bacterium]